MKTILLYVTCEGRRQQSPTVWDITEDAEASIEKFRHCFAWDHLDLAHAVELEVWAQFPDGGCVRQEIVVPIPPEGWSAPAW